MNSYFKNILTILVLTIFTKTSLFCGKVYFSHSDNLTQEVINVIDAAQTRVYVAMYTFTDFSIANALCKAKTRGCNVQVVIDEFTAEIKKDLINYLINNKIAVFIFYAKILYGKYPTKMHHKFVVTDDKVAEGSFNYTKMGATKNEENLTISKSKKKNEVFLQQFEYLKQKSIKRANKHGVQLLADKFNKKRLQRRVIRAFNAIKNKSVIKDVLLGAMQRKLREIEEKILEQQKRAKRMSSYLDSK